MNFDTDADDLYQELQKSSLVCSNCLRLNKESVKPATWTKVGGVPDPRKTEFNTVEIEFPHRGRVKQGHDGRARGECECGVVSPFAQFRPMNKYQAMQCADNLHETLDILGVSHSRDVLLQTVYRRTTTPETASQFDKNLSVAIQAARDRPVEDEKETAKV